MTNKLPIVMAATGQLNNLPGVRVQSENQLPAISTGVGSTIEHLQQISAYLSSMLHSTQKIQQYELEAMANQLRVAGMPTATVFQEIAGFFHQNYARERRAAEKTVTESAQISRGYAKSLGRNVDNIPDSQIHGKNYGDISGDLEKTVADVLVKALTYTQALTNARIQEIEGYSRNAKGLFGALHPFSREEEKEK